VPASFKSGAFDDWRAKKRTSVPRVGEAELPSSRGRFAGGRGGGAHFRHKAADPATATATRGKARSSVSKAAIARGGGKGRKLLAGGGLRSVDDMARERRAKESRVRRSTQPGKHGRGGGSAGGAKAPRGGGSGNKFGGGGKPRARGGSSSGRGRGRGRGR